MTSKRKKAYRAGFRAELIAMIYLMAKGYRLLARRYKTSVGEVDLIVCTKKRIVFVEVKRRRDAREALYAVTPKSQQRIRRAASQWLARHETEPAREVGFDVVTIVPWQRPRHYRDVFSHSAY